jgi:hypothetical protein
MTATEIAVATMKVAQVSMRGGSFEIRERSIRGFRATKLLASSTKWGKACRHGRADNGLVPAGTAGMTALFLPAGAGTFGNAGKVQIPSIVMPADINNTCWNKVGASRSTFTSNHGRRGSGSIRGDRAGRTVSEIEKLV